jgi:TonB family protein
MFLISVLFFLINSFAFAQTEEYSAPVNWQRYAVSSKDVSVLLPKMPIMISGTDACGEKEYRDYYAYADEVVYSLKITSKTKEKAPQWCSTKRKFNRDTFVERIKEIKKASETPDEEKVMLEGREVAKMVFKNSSVWLFDDLTNNRWFELAISHRENARIDIEAFVESIKFKNNPDGIEIGEGSKRTLGDEESTKENSAKSVSSEKSSTKEENYPLMIVAKPKPRYTDAARQANVQGSVTLRVTFLNNGGIGTITPVTELSHGLTEQAIIAAKKLVFLPQKKGSQAQNVVRTVQFNFSIY